MNPSRVRVVTLLALGVILALAGGVRSQGEVPLQARPVTVVVDGEVIEPDVPPVNLQGRVFVPLRPIFEALRAEVHWDQATRRVTAQANGRTVTLTIGSRQAVVNGKSLQMDVEPFILANRTMIPVRFVSQALGREVTWDPKSRAVYVGTTAPVELQLGTSPVTIALAGDVLLGGRIGEVIEAYGRDYPWEGVKALLLSASLAMVNLESPVSERGEPEADKLWTFRTKPEDVRGLRDAGVDVVNLANNHILDYGPEALADTLTYLQELGVQTVGAGPDLVAATKPVIVDLGEVSVGIIGLSQIYPRGSWAAGPDHPGVAITHNEAYVRRAVSSLKDEVDVVVVSVHWGQERAHYPSDYQKRYGRMLVDAGADLVVGHHPHVLQGFEVYRGSLIAYSLGNFIFPYTVEATKESCILLANLTDGRLQSVRILPVYTHGGHPEILSGARAREILEKIREYSSPWQTVIDDEGFIVINSR